MSDEPKRPPSSPGSEPRRPLPPRASGPAYYDTKEVPAFKGGTPESALMGEMMRRIENMHQDLLKNVDARLQDHATSSAEAHERTRRHVLALTHMFRVLWTTVKGSEPPPPPPPGAELSYSMSEPIPRTAAVPIDEQISNHDLSLASFDGRLIAVSAAQNETKAQVAELLTLQKEQMGKHEEGIALVKRVADTLRWMMLTSEGRKTLMLFLLFAATVYDRFGRLVHR